MAKVLEVKQPEEKKFLLEVNETELVMLLQAIGRTNGTTLSEELKIGMHGHFKVDHSSMANAWGVCHKLYNTLLDTARKEVTNN